MSLSLLTQDHLDRVAIEVQKGFLTIGELIALGTELDLPLSQVVVAEAMIREDKAILRQRLTAEAIAGR